MAGVYNTGQGRDGGHSVAYVRVNDKKGSWFQCYNDLSIYKVTKGKMVGFAKLMFYQEDFLSEDFLSKGFVENDSNVSI